ncbi:MAG: hypothetical protein KY475_25075 [Planctomycetes bacterium]|nr:hypothetical protein [Planctomycetota bacterium]
MRGDELIASLQARPFQPFRMFVSDGLTFDVRHPEMLLVTRHAAIVGLPGQGAPENGNGDYPNMDRHTIINLLHVTRLEQIDSSSRRSP